MPNINLSDARKRDAVVKVESTRKRRVVYFRSATGLPAYTYKILKGDITQDYDSLRQRFGNNEGLAQALIDGDPEINLEKDGMFLRNVSRVYVNPKEELVYRIRHTEIVYNPDGSERKRRDQRRLEANVDGDIPLTWTGEMIDKAELVRTVVFQTKMQVVHINGLTYDFLYGMAKELHDAKAMMVLGAGPKGRSPLIFRARSSPYRGFLEGRIKKDKYILLLHLSNMELKTPKSARESEPAGTQEKAIAEPLEVKHLKVG